MLPAIVIEKLPRLIRAVKLLPGNADEEEAGILADELAGITAMVAGKFTNDRTAEGIGRALLLTVGGISLGLEHLIQTEEEGDLDALDILIGEGAEHAFQAGFRLIRELAAAGTAIIVVSSEIEEVLGLADRVLVIGDGEVLATTNASDIDEPGVLDLVMKGSAA